MGWATFPHCAPKLSSGSHMSSLREHVIFAHILQQTNDMNLPSFWGPHEEGLPCGPLPFEFLLVDTLEKDFFIPVAHLSICPPRKAFFAPSLTAF